MAASPKRKKATRKKKSAAPQKTKTQKTKAPTTKPLSRQTMRKTVPHRRVTDMMTWTSVQFCCWFSEGAAAVADDYFGHRWTGAFPPLRLDPSRDPADQIIGNLCALVGKSSEVFERARSGLGLAMDHIARPTKPAAVEFLLNVAGALDPPGASGSVFRYVTKTGASRDPRAWDRVIDALVRITYNAGRPGETISLFECFKRTPWWNLCLPWFLRAVASHEPRRWPQVKAQYRLELYQMEREHPAFHREISDAAELRWQLMHCEAENVAAGKVDSNADARTQPSGSGRENAQRKTADIIRLAESAQWLRNRGQVRGGL